jgi:Uma2 family endonuclease
MTTGAAAFVTAEQLWGMPNDGLRRELVRGELRTMTPAGADHGGVTNAFAYLLTSHVLSHKLGKVLAAETGFILSRNPDTVVGADVAFVRADRIPPEGLPKGFWEGAPDLAVETISPSDTLEQVEEKVDAYLAAGASAVAVLNPRRKTVTIHRVGTNPVVQHVGEKLDLSNVVAGFTCDIADIFR